MRKANVGLMGAITAMGNGAMDSLINSSNSNSMIYNKPPDLAEEMMRQSELSWDTGDFGVRRGFRRYTQPVYRSAKDTRKKRKAHRAAVKLQRRLKKIRK
jgi:hypothetical protein